MFLSNSRCSENCRRSETFLLSSVYAIEKKTIHSDVLFMCCFLKYHTEVQDKLFESSFLMVDKLIEKIDKTYSSNREALQRLSIISLTCLWISCKFHIDNFLIGYKRLEKMTNIPWLRFRIAETEILKLFDYKLWEFMEDPVLTSDDDSVSDTTILPSNSDNIPRLIPIEP